MSTPKRISKEVPVIHGFAGQFWFCFRILGSLPLQRLVAFISSSLTYHRLERVVLGVGMVYIRAT